MPQITSRAEIAANVRAALAYRGKDQMSLTGVIGRSQSAVSARVRGQRNFRVDELQAIAAFLDVPLEQLIAPSADEVPA